ncbi:MAG TPA: exodeoxyribonuclease V subunit beta, partial [Chromatiaceae bacterium]|nr:exodeoxyribonuclease V subunit beta [Chromatiaceae bacterium]
MVMPVLQPFSMPLDGVHLIEASAGTGKTFSITSLYLRLLLERQLSVEHILVVTFTRAATEELRDRIRGRIRVALGILEGDAAAKEKDPELADWLAGRAADGDARLLRIALASMDSAAVFTIHGFCQRVLTENAFDTGMAFDLEFIENEDELRLAAVEDFWRIFFADESLPSQVVSALLRAHDSPAGLLARISNRLTADLRLLPEPAPLEEQVAEMSAALVRLEAAHRQLKECWEKEGERVTGILRGSPALNRRTYNNNNSNSAVEKALAAATEICSAVSPGLDAFEKQELLTSRCIKEKTKAGQSPPVNPFFDAAEHYFDLQEEASASMKTMEVAFLAEARRFVRAHLERAKEDRRQLYFDDLLSRLDAALAGEGGENLAEHLRRQYPFALIDEFQDTDAVQYRIFRAMYGEEAIDHGLCLVGDPKQAIYGFRGGDVYTYLEAARDARQRFSLETNWRSSSRLVDA